MEDFYQVDKTLNMFMRYTFDTNLGKFAKDLYPDEDLSKDYALEYVRGKFHIFRDKSILYWAESPRYHRAIILQKMIEHAENHH